MPLLRISRVADLESNSLSPIVVDKVILAQYFSAKYLQLQKPGE